jgi:drug/metabolite transporter (DMT)-like permease
VNADLALAGFGLLSALSWGVADFSGGVASRRASSLAVVFFSTVLGGVFVFAAAVARGELSVPAADLPWAFLAGLTGSTALVFFYRGLATGPMGVVAPIAGVLGAAIPVVVGVVLQGLPTTDQIAGIALALCSVVLVTASTHRAGTGWQGAGMAIAAGIGFGLFFVFLGQVHGGGPFAPLVIVRTVASLLIGAMVVATRTRWRLPRAALIPATISGALDMGGNLFYLLAAQQGRLDVAAVLASLYPVVTVLLAAALLREHVGRLQAMGIAAAVAAIVLIAR